MQTLEINPWVEMWFRPRKTIQAIVGVSPNYGLKLLSFIYGLVSLLSFAQTFSWGIYIGMIPIILFILIAAPFWGYFVFSFSSWIIYRTGRWFKGQASRKETRAAIAWSNVPMMVNLILWGGAFYVFREALFVGFLGSYFFQENTFYWLLSFCVAQLLMGIWSLVLLLNALAKVMHYSLFKAIVNLLVSGFIIFVSYVVVGLLLMWVSPYLIQALYMA
jgi:hypothetical protein